MGRDGGGGVWRESEIARDNEWTGKQQTNKQECERKEKAKRANTTVQKIQKCRRKAKQEKHCTNERDRRRERER